jgi:hypothetical protein
MAGVAAESAKAPAVPVATAHAGGGRALVLALLVTLLLWNVPYGSYALYPFKVFATWLHESSHAVMMLLTGAGVRKLQIFRDTSGLAVPSAGVTRAAQVAISSAGYMGTALIGALLLVLGRNRQRARLALGIVGFLMLLTTLVWVSNGFGIAAIATFGALAAIMAGLASDRVCVFVLNLIAAQACINAVLDIRVLFAANMYVNGKPYQQSDAHAVSSLVGGPPWFWAALWMLWSFALFFVALRWVRLEQRKIRP